MPEMSIRNYILLFLNFQLEDIADFAQSTIRYYLRMWVCDQPGVMEKVAHVLAAERISIASVIQKERDLKGGIGAAGDRHARGAGRGHATGGARDRRPRCRRGVPATDSHGGSVVVKYVVLVPDGAADYPQDQLGNRTPLEAADTPNMDRLATEGMGGMVQIIPEEQHPGSDIGNLEIFGYDSVRNYTGRAPLEAASMGVELPEGAIAFRCNLINRDGDTLVDYSAGHISTEEGQALIELVTPRLEEEGIRFYPGVQYRHLMVYQNGPEELISYPPHDIMGQSVAAHLPVGEGQEKIRELMAAAEPLLAEAAVNQQRAAEGKRSANAIWLWGSGRALQLESMEKRHGVRGGVISAVDLVRGIGRSAGLEVIAVPGITGYLDTNYAGKASFALDALERCDLVYVHVEAADEAAHNGDALAKVQALEDFDRLVVGNVLAGLERFGACRVLMAPDHRTPIQLRTHSREPVPFVLWGSGLAADGMTSFSESGGEQGSLQLERGYQMMELLMKGSV